MTDRLTGVCTAPHPIDLDDGRTLAPGEKFAAADGPVLQRALADGHVRTDPAKREAKPASETPDQEASDRDQAKGSRPKSTSRATRRTPTPPRTSGTEQEETT